MATKRDLSGLLAEFESEIDDLTKKQPDAKKHKADSPTHKESRSVRSRGVAPILRYDPVKDKDSIPMRPVARMKAVFPDPEPARPAEEAVALLYSNPDETFREQDPAVLEKKKKKMFRNAADKKWEDRSMADWPDNDFRLFVGDLGPEVSDEMLKRAFMTYPSFIMSRVIRDSRTDKSKGYGFVSFLNSDDYTRAFRDWNGKYLGNRPIKLRKSTWAERQGKPH
jgi:hypothetical protein